MTFTEIISYIIELYKYLILATVLLSWLPMLGIRLDSYNPIVQFLHQVTNPVLAPLRPYCRIGMTDLSPLVAFFIIGFIQQLILGQANIARMIAISVSLVIAFTVHEFMHAYVAYRLGDSTAKDQGRMTLDPRRHLDVLGTMMVLTVGFGWAKPVPVTPYYLRYGPKLGLAIVAAAGPLSNLALAFLAAIPLRLGLIQQTFSGAIIPSLFGLFFSFIFLNIILFFFNLIPLAPLDGFKIVSGLLPPEAARSFNQLEPMGPILLLMFLIFDYVGGGGIFSSLIIPPTDFVTGLLTGYVR